MAKFLVGVAFGISITYHYISVRAYNLGYNEAKAEMKHR